MTRDGWYWVCIVLYQVAMDSLKHELLEVQQMRASDLEKHRREEARLQDRYDSLTRFVEVRPHCWCCLIPGTTVFNCNSNPLILYVTLQYDIRNLS